MDDKKFDDIIRDQLGEYEAPGFDEGALEDFRQKMSSIQPPKPWYVNYRKEILIGSSMIVLLLLFWRGWYVQNESLIRLSKEIAVLEEVNRNLQASENQNIELLNAELSDLKNKIPDTVTVIRIKEIFAYEDQNISRPVYDSRSGMIYLGKKDEIPAELIGNLQHNGFIREDQGNYYLMNSTLVASTENRGIGLSEGYKRAPQLFMVEKADNREMDPERALEGLSPQTIRDMEAHYQKGVGIRLGPVLELSKGLYNAGESNIELGIGLLGDVIFSPGLSLETGIKFALRNHELDNPGAEIPMINDTLGPLNSAEVDSWVYEIPFNLKYRYPINSRTHWVAGLGYSMILYSRQEFDYSYEISGNPGSDGLSINAVNKVEDIHINPGTINLSIGLQHKLKNNKILETSLLYQNGLGEFGLEGSKYKFLGLRGTYWFKVR